MAKNKQKQVEAAKASAVLQETTQASTIEEFASEVLSAFEKEVESCKSRQRGMSLPMQEVIYAIDLIFDVTATDRAPVKLMAHKVADILKFRYNKMSSTVTNEITVRLNPRTIMMVPENELKEMRLAQLKHMQESKTDNLYRRIYNIGSRAEYGRFDIANSMIVRVKKIESSEDIPSE